MDSTESRLSRATFEADSLSPTGTDGAYMIRSYGSRKFETPFVNQLQVQNTWVDGDGSNTQVGLNEHTHVRVTVTGPGINSTEWFAQSYTPAVPPATSGTWNSGYPAMRDWINANKSSFSMTVNVSDPTDSSLATPEYVPQLTRTLTGGGVYIFGTATLYTGDDIRSGFIAMNNSVTVENQDTGEAEEVNTINWLDTSGPTDIWRDTDLPNPIGPEYIAPECPIIGNPFF
jgi:hypothetical protein